MLMIKAILITHKTSPTKSIRRSIPISACSNGDFNLVRLYFFNNDRYPFLISMIRPAKVKTIPMVCIASP